jgi:hypothetical protein
MLVHVYMGTVVNVYGYEGDPCIQPNMPMLNQVQTHKDLLNYVSSWCFIQSIT